MLLTVQRYFHYLKYGWKKITQPDRGFDEKSRSNFYNQIWTEAARCIGAESRELRDGFLEIRLGNRTTRVYQAHTMIDHPLTIRLAVNKPLVYQLLAQEGLPVPPHCAYRLSTMEHAESFLANQKGPCVVKPARESGGGQGVTTNIRTPRELRSASVQASLFNHNLLIEQQIAGESYRLLYLGGKLLDAVRRKAPIVIGDGQSTIKELIEKENRRRLHQEGGAALQVIAIDLDCKAALRSAGLTLSSIPSAGVEIRIKQVANDNSDREMESVRHLVCKELEVECARAARAAGVILAGVDIMTTDITRSLSASGGFILEVNATPGLHFHYQTATPGVAVAVPILRSLLQGSEETFTDNLKGKSVEFDR